MRTHNDIHTDWNLSTFKIVKPENLNALTRAVPYDYIVTGKMLEGKTGTVDVDALLGGGKINGITGEYHVLINTVVPNDITLLFPADSVGGPSGELKVHVHTIGPFKASFGQSGIPYIKHYFHTHGEAEAVTLLDVPHTLYVGSFKMTPAVQLGNTHIFVYETAFENIPTTGASFTGTLEKKAWLSNSIDERIPSGIRRLSYVDKNGTTMEYASSGIIPLDSMAGLTEASPLDLSNATTIDWITWSRRGVVGDPHMVENSYTDLYIDPDTMVEGVVYAINVSCYADLNENRVTGGMAVTKFPNDFSFKYKFTSDFGNQTVLSPNAQPLPTITPGQTCTVDMEAVAAYTDRIKFTFGAPISMEYEIGMNHAYTWNLPSSRAGCAIEASAGSIQVNLGKPAGYTGTMDEIVTLGSNIGINNGAVSDVSYTIPELNILRVAVPSTASAQFWVPSASSGLASILINLTEKTRRHDPAAAPVMNSTNNPTYQGNVYLMKVGAKVFVLGY